MEFLGVRDGGCTVCSTSTSKCGSCWTKWFLGGFGHIFVKHGLVNLKQYVTPHGVSFTNDDRHLPHPRIGFITINAHDERRMLNLKECERLLGVTGTGVERMHVFLSVANFSRNCYERDPQHKESMLPEIAAMYTRAIVSSGDERGIQICEIIASRSDHFTLCTDADGATASSAEVRAAVAEALAGLAVVAVHQDQMHMAVGYAVAALCKHASVLPFVNCARVVALVKPRNVQTVVHLTRFAILPYFKRIGDTRSYEQEIRIWGAEFKDLLGDLRVSMIGDWRADDGGSTTIRGVYRNSMFVPKVCFVCRKGTGLGEKVKACARCGMAYYCSKQCQTTHWPEYKHVCQV
jgi:hypothetical protein